MFSVRKKLLLLTGLILTLLSFPVQAQKITFSGKVIDMTTGNTLPGANIYLSGTTFGDASDGEGNFFFETSTLGRFNLVVSSVGYKTRSIPVVLSGPASVYEEIMMEPDLVQLSEIEVTSISDRDWQRVYGDFKSFFLGRDEYAQSTEIINPTVIDFRWDETEESYYVTTSEPLVIQNNALGYESVVEFEEVYFNPETKGGVYIMYPRISEMDPVDYNDPQVWRYNRLKSYLGSSRHFFSSLAEGSLLEEGFTIFPGNSRVAAVTDSSTWSLFFPNDWKQLMKDYKAFRVSERTFQVGYQIEYNWRGKISNGDMISTVTLTGISDIILIDQNGLLRNPQYVQFTGKWEGDRFARHLPIEYQPYQR